MWVLRSDRAGLYSRSEGLDAREARTYGRALCRRCVGEPLQHLTGEQAFMGLTLRVEPGVFIPRPETEILVEVTWDALSGESAPVVVDVGTGTGAIALALKHAHPDATVLATDVSAAAVELARTNAARLGLEVQVEEGELLDPVDRELRGRLSAIVSNPPYIAAAAFEALPKEVRADPYRALVGGTDLHARLAELAPAWLRPRGWLVMEIGADQAAEVTALLRRAGLGSVEVVRDLAGRDRVVRGRTPAAGP